MIRTATDPTRPPGATAGFTLLEVLVVLTILGMMAAMLYPMAGYLNNRERERITRDTMVEIRRALVGDPDRFDEAGRRIIGGYVGDMGAWPDLWEAAPQVKEAVVGTPPDFDALGNANNPDIYYYRPMGRFVAGNWRWNTPFRRLTHDTVHNSDHIGGLETENEGQPVGLWTNDPGGEGTELLDPTRWKGPYLVRPTDDKPEDSQHLAESDDQYYRLEPAYGTGPVESWEDGDYTPIPPKAGEYGDDKERFRLLQTDGRLADGWGRSLRFFITSDPDAPEDADRTVFWIISEGADRMATYPTKGTWTGSSWDVDPDDRMGTRYDAAAAEPKGYNPDDPYNQDNIVMRIASTEWQAVIEARNQRKRRQTEALMEQVRRALIGTATSGESGFNSGYTGALCRWPGLFRWVDNYWDDESQEATPEPYTKGQPRGLWTDQPNTGSDPDARAFDRLPGPALTITDPSASIGTGTGPGIGWRGPYLPPPLGSGGSGADNRLVDAWGRELLFFMDTTNDLLLVLSRGPDGRFDFGDTDTLPEGAPDGDNDYLEPADWTEAVDITGYDPNDAGGHNADNVVMILRGTDWRPGRLTVESLSVAHATANTKARFVSGVDADGVVQSVLYTAGVDGTLTGDTWTLGPLPQALHFDGSACTGTRQLVVWEDDGATPDAVDSGERYATINYNLHTHGGLEPRSNLTLDTLLFTPAP